MANIIIPPVVNWSVTPQNGTEDYFNKMNTWLTESTVVISSFNKSVAKTNELNIYLNQTKDHIDNVVSDSNEALSNANEVKANMEQINRLAYGLTQMPVTMAKVIDGELIMYFTDPIKSLSLVDGDLIVNY